MTYDEIAEIDRQYDADFYLPLGPGRGRTHPEGAREMDGEKLKAASAMLAALKGVTRILEAVTFTVGLRGNQLDRLYAARAAIAQAEAAGIAQAALRTPAPGGE